jgi:hypothetical protein
MTVVVEHLVDSENQRDVSLLLDDVELRPRNVPAEPHRMLGPDVPIIRAVPDRHRDTDLIKVESQG